MILRILDFGNASKARVNAPGPMIGQRGYADIDVIGSPGKASMITLPFDPAGT